MPQNTFWILHLQKNQQNYIHIILPTYVVADFELHKQFLKTLSGVSLKKNILVTY